MVFLLNGVTQYSEPRLPEEEIRNLASCYTEDCEVYPAFANYVLDYHNRRNRPLYMANAHRWAKIMESGRWDFTHQGLAFDTNFDLVDGQTRLMACKLANKPFKTKITWNVPPETRDTVDQGQTRNARDLCHFHGLTWVTVHHVALAASLYYGPFYRQDILRKEDYPALIQKHVDAIQFAWKVLPQNSDYRALTNHGIRGVLARAYYHLDQSVIRRFAEILYSGMPSSKDPASEGVIILRNRLLLGIKSRSSAEIRDEIYQRTQNGLWLYSRGEVKQQIAAIQRDFFPLK